MEYLELLKSLPTESTIIIKGEATNIALLSYDIMTGGTNSNESSKTYLNKINNRKVKLFYKNIFYFPLTIIISNIRNSNSYSQLLNKWVDDYDITISFFELDYPTPWKTDLIHSFFSKGKSTKFVSSNGLSSLKKLKSMDEDFTPFNKAYGY